MSATLDCTIFRDFLRISFLFVLLLWLLVSFLFSVAALDRLRSLRLLPLMASSFCVTALIPDSVPAFSQVSAGSRFPEQTMSAEGSVTLVSKLLRSASNLRPLSSRVYRSFF